MPLVWRRGRGLWQPALRTGQVSGGHGGPVLTPYLLALHFRTLTQDCVSDGLAPWP